ncbi:hypothetical protein Poli38472_006417 [Pythium oligandrum]|uniref:Uncharacterized protein n=1 Tax=Pythium oligandrum TaxID=41045 RepID=A0A8K1C4L8_PYTOL|nr:hypothetical protein Poli38472_006417 [Pythium oligandrum]|eukprot:TMW56407.1 hypothetical protein Poli38472_006417 [Pythium oligandrum]
MFREAFLKATDIDWGKVTEDIPGSETGVYLIVDEIQAFYKRGDLTSASLSSYEFWKLVTRVSTTTVKRMHVMMLAGDGSSGYYADLEPPVLITTKERHMGVSDINFNQDEIRGYVVARFEKQVLCGGHVGICTSAIDVMNQIARSRVQSVNRYPTAQEWRYYPVYDKVNYKSSRQYSPKAQMLP